MGFPTLPHSGSGYPATEPAQQPTWYDRSQERGGFMGYLGRLFDLNDDQRLGARDAFGWLTRILGGPAGIGLGIAAESATDTAPLVRDWIRNRGNADPGAPAVQRPVSQVRNSGGLNQTDPSQGSEPGARREYLGHTGPPVFGMGGMLDASSSGNIGAGMGGVELTHRMGFDRGMPTGMAPNRTQTVIRNFGDPTAGLTGVTRSSGSLFGGYQQGSPLSGIERFLQDQQAQNQQLQDPSQTFHPTTPDMGMFQQPPPGYQRDPIWPEISRDSSYMMQPAGGGPGIPVIEGPRWLGPRFDPNAWQRPQQPYPF